MYSVDERVAAIESLIISSIVFTGAFLFLNSSSCNTGLKLTIALAVSIAAYVTVLFSIFKIAHSITRRVSMRFAMSLDKFFEKNMLLLDHIIKILLIITASLTFKMIGYSWWYILGALVLCGIFLVPRHYYKKKFKK